MAQADIQFNFGPLARDAEKRVDSLKRYAEQIAIITELTNDVTRSVIAQENIEDGSKEQEKQQEQLKELESAVELFADLERKFVVQERCMLKIRDHINESDQKDIQEMDFNKLVKDFSSEIEENPDQQIQDAYDRRIHEFRGLTQEFSQDEEGGGGGGKDEAEGSDSDDDMEVIQREETNALMCPITLKPIENAMRSKVCQHAFEKSAIEHIIGKKPNIRCPQAGCSKKFGKKDLEHAVDLEFVQKRRKRARNRQEKNEDAPAMDFTQASASQ